MQGFGFSSNLLPMVTAEIFRGIHVFFVCFPFQIFLVKIFDWFSFHFCPSNEKPKPCTHCRMDLFFDWSARRRWNSEPDCFREELWRIRVQSLYWNGRKIFETHDSHPFLLRLFYDRPNGLKKAGRKKRAALTPRKGIEKSKGNIAARGKFPLAESEFPVLESKFPIGESTC